MIQGVYYSHNERMFIIHRFTQVGNNSQVQTGCLLNTGGHKWLIIHRLQRAFTKHILRQVVEYSHHDTCSLFHTS